MPHGKARLGSQEVRSNLWGSAENKPPLEGVSRVGSGAMRRSASCTTSLLIPSQGDKQHMLFYSKSTSGGREISISR